LANPFQSKQQHESIHVFEKNNFHIALWMKSGVPTMLDIPSLAKYILSPECQSIAFLTGAGVSVASGIPDFRSPGGLYDSLRPELLTCSPREQKMMERDPTYVVSWDIFKSNSFPYLEVRRPFILGTQRGQWRATIAHRFAELLHIKTQKLTRVYTQNIDGLYRQCKMIPDEKIVSVHGSISKVSCEGCGTAMNYDTFCDMVSKNIKDIYNIDPNAPSKSSPIPCSKCQKSLVKPSTVLFGRALPEEFWTCSEQDLPKLDLLFVAGTSLLVAPANSLVYRTEPSTLKVLVNLHPVGQNLGIEYDNLEASNSLFLQGSCDEIFLKLIEELGWQTELKLETLPESSAKLLRDSRSVDK
jgi:NAD-dependent SIR2 family protein deacetylase